MKQIVIIGGGISGLSSAYYLKKAGNNVTVIDTHGGKSGASYGNAGFIGSSHYIPLSNPNSFKNALRWMLSPTSPFYVHPTLNPDIIKWGLLFMRHANQHHLEKSAHPLVEIGLLSQRLFEEWEKDFGGFAYEKKGLINIFQSEKALLDEEKEIKRAKSFGLDVVVLTKSELEAREPHVKFNAIGAVDMQSDAHAYPPEVMAALLKEVHNLGVDIITDSVIGFKFQNEHLAAVECKSQNLPADEFVLTGGIWSHDLAKLLHTSLPMAPGRGYSITYPIEQCPISHPLYLSEAAVAITPMDGDKVRFGGTMEIVKVGTPPRLNRMKGILNSARRYLPELKFPTPKVDDFWFGYRPVSADGIPYIGRSQRHSNLTVATGHSMLGFGLGPATGKLVSELVMSEPTSIDIKAFALDRF